MPSPLRQSQALSALSPQIEILHANRAAWVRPEKGWIRTVRNALGLPLDALAKRTGISKQAFNALEASEIESRITLASLQRCADALDCDVVYALVPRSGVLPNPDSAPVTGNVDTPAE